MVPFLRAGTYTKEYGLISCEIVGRRKGLTVLGKGLEVLCTYKFTVEPATTDQTSC